MKLRWRTAIELQQKPSRDHAGALNCFRCDLRGHTERVFLNISVPEAIEGKAWHANRHGVFSCLRRSEAQIIVLRQTTPIALADGMPMQHQYPFTILIVVRFGHRLALAPAVCRSRAERHTSSRHPDRCHR